MTTQPRWRTPQSLLLNGTPSVTVWRKPPQKLSDSVTRSIKTGLMITMSLSVNCFDKRMRLMLQNFKIQTPPQLQNKWKELRSRAEKELRLMENDWWSEKARQIQGFADSNETQKFCEAIQTVYGPTHHTIHAPCWLRGCKNGPTLFPGRMSYKATKPELAVCHILACFLSCCCLLGPLLCIVSFHCICSVFWLF